MQLQWQRDPNADHRFVAETVRFRFVMLRVPRTKPQLWVQHAMDEWATKPIDQRVCRNRRHAERLAQRFENQVFARRLR